MSKVPGEKGMHFFLGDFDDVGEELIMDRIGNILFNRHKFGMTYLIKTGRGWHIASFSVKLPLAEYTEILEEMRADEEYVKWVRKVKYGVLRISRRSVHFTVPYLYRVLIPPWKSDENTFYRDFYFSLLSMENEIMDIQRVRVLK